MDDILSRGNHTNADANRDLAAGRYFLDMADRRIGQQLSALKDNDDAQTTSVANITLEGF
jgi:hypothetical protein